MTAGRFSRQDAEDFCIVSQRFTEEAVDFQRKVMWFSGLGNETYLPPWCSKFPQTTSMEKARLEFDLVIMTSIEDLLKKTGVKPKEIGVVVVNCSLFTPTPSLSASIMNRFKMGNNVINYNLGGMGCSAGVIAIDLARQMLELKPNTYALVISTENITQNMYNGTQRSMLIPNVIFRVGGAAMLLSNKRKEAFRSKYVLKHVVRTTMAHVDDAYNCVMELEDSQGHRGVKLSKDLMKIAGQSLKSNITSLGPKVLPISEQLLFAANFIGRRVFGMKSLKPYVPDFSLAVDHICIHTGGRGVVDEIEKQLALSPYMTEPSRAALYKYGNVSSSSIWYVLSFIETYRGLKRGDLVWQIGFGSGFKCNSAIWKANKSFQDDHIAWKGFNLPAMYEDLATLQLKLNALLESMGKEQYNRESVTGGHTTGMGRPSSNGGIQK